MEIQNNSQKQVQQLENPTSPNVGHSHGRTFSLNPTQKACMLGIAAVVIFDNMPKADAGPLFNAACFGICQAFRAISIGPVAVLDITTCLTMCSPTMTTPIV